MCYYQYTMPPFPCQGISAAAAGDSVLPLDFSHRCAKLIGSKLPILEVIILNPPFGHLFRVLHTCTDRSISNALAAMELTAAQGHIMGYLALRKDPPCPRDIEEAFQLSHPTVSGLLSRLEKKDFITLRTDENDRRCKRIYVLPKGRELQETMHRTIFSMEEQLVRDFTPEEKEQFAQLLYRAIANMGETPCKRKPFHKEESHE